MSTITSQTANLCPNCHREVPVDPFYGCRWCSDCGINVTITRQIRANQEKVRLNQQDLAKQRSRCAAAAHPSRVDNAGVPLSIKRWNGPAFVFGWIWCFCNGLPLWGIASLLGWVLTAGFAALIIDIILGFNGNEYAWRARVYTNVDEYWRSQRGWQIALYIFMGAVVIAIVGMIRWIQ